RATSRAMPAARPTPSGAGIMSAIDQAVHTRLSAEGMDAAMSIVFGDPTARPDVGPASTPSCCSVVIAFSLLRGLRLLRGVHALFGGQLLGGLLLDLADQPVGGRPVLGLAAHRIALAFTLVVFFGAGGPGAAGHHPPVGPQEQG